MVVHLSFPLLSSRCRCHTPPSWNPYHHQASALAASGTSAPASRRNGNSSSNILSANRRSQKAEREAGATSASTSGLASVPPPLSVTAAASSSLSSSSVPPPSSHPDLEENQRQENPRQASSSKTHSREGSGVLSSATTANSSTAREVGRGATVNARGGREGRSSGKEASTRPRPKGAVGVAETPSGGGGEGVSVRGGGFGSGLDKKHVSSGVAPSSTAPVRPPVVAFDLAGFVEKMDAGVLLTKINRQGRAKVRTLFYDEQNGMLWWNETGSSAGRGAHRPLSSSLFLRKEQPLPVASLVQVCVVIVRQLFPQVGSTFHTLPVTFV